MLPYQNPILYYPILLYYSNLNKTNHRMALDFKELKKELKGIEVLSKENLDIQTWYSDIQLWAELQDVTDPKKIFIACVLTSKGEPRKIIQQLENKDQEEDEESEDDDEDSENEDPVTGYPSLPQIVEALETFYGVKEDQNQLLRELRALKIGRFEKVKNFNKRYRSLYLKLNKHKKKHVSVLDYAESLQNNKEAWKRVSLKDEISLEKAFTVAEKVDRLSLIRGNDNGNSSIQQNPSNNNHNNHLNQSFRRKPVVEQKPIDKGIERDELVYKMRNLTIKTCYFCGEKGHYQQQCPKLRAIIEDNKNKLFSKNLNH